MGLAATAAYLAIIGFLGWRAWRGGDTEKVMFVVNVVLLWLSAIWLFGYPALIGRAVFAAGGFLLFLVVLTSSDLKIPVARKEPETPPAPARATAPKRAVVAQASAQAPSPVRSATVSS